MPYFLRPDQVLFWLIILAISIIWWLRHLWIRLYKRTVRLLGNRLAGEQEEDSTGIEIMYREELFQQAQENHLASKYFPLSEIAVHPKLQVPTPDYDPENPISHLPITNEIIPYMPDMPGLAAYYNPPSIKIEEAIETGVNIGLIAPAGSGKTFTLNWLAAELSQRKPELGSFSERLPILIHAADLDLSSNTNKPINALTKCWENRNSLMNINEINALIEKHMKDRNAIILLDGLDELPSEKAEPVIEFFGYLKNEFPGNKFIVSLSPYDLSALEPLNLYPVSLAYWNEIDLSDILIKWQSEWDKNVNQKAETEVILRKLLFEKGKGLSPFKITLKIWNLLSQEVPGANITDDLDAYLSRTTKGLKDADLVLQAIASKYFSSNSFYLPSNSIGNGSDIIKVPNRTIRNLIPALIDRGLLVKRNSDQVGFTHLLILSYLASKTTAPSSALNKLNKDYRWEINHRIFEFSPIESEDPEYIDECFKMNRKSPLRFYSVRAGSWLRVLQPNSTQLQKVLQLLALEIQNENLPYNLRIRLAACVAFSDVKGVRHLFRKLIQSSNIQSVILGLLGAGIVKDIDSIDRIGELLLHEQPLINQAACLVLTRIDTKECREKLAKGLLHASDSSKIIIAEALATKPDYGHQIIKDSTKEHNPGVRRAAVFGLSKIREEWARDIIEELSQDDEEWLVRIAAADALSLSYKETWKLPKPIVKLNKSPWLVNFAAEKGVGVGSGDAVWELVEAAVAEGNPQQELAALHILNKVPFKAYNLSTELLDLLKSPDLTINERVYNLLLSLMAVGINVK